MHFFFSRLTTRQTFYLGEGLHFTALIAFCASVTSNSHNSVLLPVGKIVIRNRFFPKNILGLTPTNGISFGSENTCRKLGRCGPLSKRQLTPICPLVIA